MDKFLASIIDKTWDDLSIETVSAAKKVLLDTIGAMIAGANEAPTKQLIKQLKAENEGTYAVIGSDVCLTLEAAAFIHGVSSVAIEMDEGNQWSKGHPAAHVVPALLTELERHEGVDGKAFITMLVKAYELCSRFGRATTLVPDAHAHGTWGVMGAAAAIMLYYDYSAEELRDGLNLSASFAMPTKWDAALEGALVRNVYVGNAIQQAIRTNDLLQAGFLAPKNNIEYVYGEIIGRKFDDAAFFEPSESWDIEKNYFKDHAFCRYAHAPLDAYKALIEEHDIPIDAIKRVNVFTYQRAATLKRADYHNALSAKFSIPYALAVWSYTKRADHSVFQEAYLQDEKIRKLAEKVVVVASEELEKDYPTIMPAEVEIILHSGKTYKKRLDLADSGLGPSVTYDHLAEKFISLTSHYDEEKQKKIIEFIDHIETKEDVKPLISLLRHEQEMGESD